MVVFFVLYINDILLIRNDLGLLSQVKIWLSTQFQMKDLSEVQYILGIKVLQDRIGRLHCLQPTLLSFWSSM